jgi:hypothetical protein
MMYMNSATFRTPKKASLSEERSTSLKMFIARFPFFPSRTEVIDAGTALLSRVSLSYGRYGRPNVLQTAGPHLNVAPIR